MVLSVLPQSFINNINVTAHPQASMKHCTDLTCGTEDVAYSSFEGDTEIYQVSVDAGPNYGREHERRRVIKKKEKEKKYRNLRS